MRALLIRDTRQAFSLIEIAIVLVIVGLLVGSVFAGQALVRSSELRTIATDFSKYHTAVFAFREQYLGFAGDITNATTFWGDRATGTEACPDAAIPNGSPGTCNGNGDGFINIGGEGHRMWQQLALAGQISGSYTGYNGGGTGCGGDCDDIGGVNAPAGSLSSTGFSVSRTGQVPSDDAIMLFSTVMINGGSNQIIFGRKETNFYFQNAALKPADAMYVDVKIDDGKPQYGAVFPYRHTGCTTTDQPETANYDTVSSSINCILIYQY